jgi:hypothetical protein
MTPTKPTHTVTTPEAVAALLTGLLLRPVTVKRSTVGINLAVPAPVWIAQYPHDDGTYGGVCMCDMKLAAYLAASLSLVPAGAAHDAIRSRSLPADLLENFREVLNICSQLFLYEDAPRVSFQSLVVFPANIQDVVREIIFHPDGRLDLDVTIPSYGTGKMAFRCA